MSYARQYTATYDDGHDYGSFIYRSEHRNGSKANLEDAYKEFEKHHGYARRRQIEITNTYLNAREFF